jgi:hypothetical protein
MKVPTKDIVISYSHQDRARVAPLAKALEAQAWTVWWDRLIPAGQAFDEDIEQALTAAKCIIVIWSKNSITSRWVKNEAAEGAERSILVPVLIDKVTIPLAFRGLQAIELIGWPKASTQDSFKRLIEDVSRFVGPSSLAEDDPGRQSSQFAIVESSPAAAESVESPPLGCMPSSLPYVVLLFCCLLGGLFLAAIASAIVSFDRPIPDSVFIPSLVGCVIIYPFIGMLVTYVANKLRMWANEGRVKELSKANKIFQTAFWPIVFFYSLVWYPFFWAVNKIIRN